MRRLFQTSSHKADINGQTITVRSDETLLQAALRQDIDIPSICRVGGCGTCKCRLKEGRVDALTETAYLLTEKEIDEGYILACQSRLRSDIRVDVDREAGISGTRIKGVIVGKTMLTHDICRIDVKLEQPIAYRAGQFAEVTLANLPDAPRSYSFSSAPSGDGRVNFTIRRVPGGRLSTHLVDRAVAGDELQVRGPGGKFWMRPGSDPVLMVAGGSGLAPILGMLQEMHQRGDRRPVTVLFGARTQRDLYALEELASYGETWPELSFVPILSEAAATDRWDGRKGLVTDHIKELANHATSAYLCGPPAMIDAAVEMLHDIGIAEENVHADRFLERQPKTHTGFYGAVGLPTVERTPAKVTDYLKFFMFHLVGVVGALGLIGGGIDNIAGALAVVAFYVGGDALSGDDTTTPAYRRPWILTVQLWLALPLLAVDLFCLLWGFSPGDPLGFGAFVSQLTGYDMFAARAATTVGQHVGGVILSGLLIGFLGTVTAHELTHRTWDPVSLLIGRWLLAFSYDTGFSIEHVYGHHRYVSTEHDPATAPRGRNVYFHVVASTIKGNISAWKIEAERLKRKHLGLFSWRNAYLRGVFMSVILAAIAWTMAGWSGVLAFSGAALFGKALLEIVNYMEHYGMVRVADQPVQPRHSWNTNSRMSSWGMFNLSRHSHHHAQGEVPYQDLMPLPDAPMMVGGYMATMIITLCPPLWHRLMTPKVIDWDRRYASPEERALALRASQRSGLAALASYDPRQWDATVAR
ncbi:fatty acid desaturase [Burkholderia sp. F1]|uniref:fatty acid desaturase n=1 Tax=Burkholderia sp. F1 TaxID=3366817 RepID=UPI003D7574B3